jgi:hypothetical protein
MTERMRLPNRRASESFGFKLHAFNYIASISRFPNGDLAEIFLTIGKVGSDTDTAARDSAAVCSIALQHGVPLETIQRALMRDANGKASGPLAAALDKVAGAP